MKVKEESGLPYPHNQNFWHNAYLRNWRASPYNINPALYSPCALESYPMHIYSSSELPTRLKLFRGSLNTIVEINNQDLGWTAKLTPFASMSPAERQQHLGLNATSMEEPAPESETPAPKIRASSMDWVARGAVSPVRRQLGGTCWSYSTIHPLEGAYAVTTGRLVEFSPQILIDCVYPGASIDRGGFPSEATKWIQSHQVFPGWNDYRPVKRVNACNTRRVNRITKARVTGFEKIEQSAQALQNALSISPVSILYYATEKFYFYGNGIYGDRTCRSSIYDLNHAVTAVGYTSSQHHLQDQKQLGNMVGQLLLCQLETTGRLWYSFKEHQN